MHARHRRSDPLAGCERRSRGRCPPPARGRRSGTRGPGAARRAARPVEARRLCARARAFGTDDRRHRRARPPLVALSRRRPRARRAPRRGGAARARNADDAVKRVKRRLHQAVGAFRGAAPRRRLAAAWPATSATRRSAPPAPTRCGRHASTRERLAVTSSGSSPAIWELTGVPAAPARPRLRAQPAGAAVDGPRAGRDLPGRRRGRSAPWRRSAVSSTSSGSRTRSHAPISWPSVRPTTRTSRCSSSSSRRSIARTPTRRPACCGALEARHAVVSFPTRIAGRAPRGMERTYRRRLERLVADARVASTPWRRHRSRTSSSSC